MSNANSTTTGLKNFFGFLRRIFLLEKLANPWGLALFILAGCCIGYLAGHFGKTATILFAIAMIAIPTVYGVVAYPKFGITVLLIAAYLLMWVIRFGVNFPLGTLMDGLQALLLIGFFIKQKSDPQWKIYKNPVSYAMLAWIIYNLIQIANPSAESRLAWIYTIRSVAVVMMMYFIFLYHIRSVGFVKFIIKLWLALSLFAALYAFKQEYIGFFAFEEEGLQSELMRSLLFIGGRWRKFSIFSDPVAFSYNMAASCLLCVGLSFAPVKLYKKLALLAMSLLFIWAMLFSGTRGAYVLVPAGLALLSILKMNKRVLLMAVTGAAIMVAVIFVPTSNYTLIRFQSAFKPSDDESFNVRKMNQKRIQPFIQTHPVGGGLGATGVWGQRFAPYSFLANFPPDSGYVRVAVELGWIGLLLFCTVMFLAIKSGINNYFRIRDPMLKSICLALTLVIFALHIGNYPQEAFVQFPTNIYLYLAIALIGVTLKLDQEKPTNHAG